jgi:hypothetical protein
MKSLQGAMNIISVCLIICIIKSYNEGTKILGRRKNQWLGIVQVVDLFGLDVRWELSKCTTTHAGAASHITGLVQDFVCPT